MTLTENQMALIYACLPTGRFLTRDRPAADALLGRHQDTQEIYG